MRVSGFTFIRNGVKLGYPFLESIRSALPLVDEFVVAMGDSDDGTTQSLQSLAQGESKLRLIPMRWNTQAPAAFVYAAQSMAALYNCTGDWALYLQGDEALHEQDFDQVRASLRQAEQDPGVEGLVFDYIHFYGSPSHVVRSPAWYRREVRIVRNRGVKVVMPSDAQYFVAIQGRKRLRYLRCRSANARVYHYGWARPSPEHAAKVQTMNQMYHTAMVSRGREDVDPTTIHPFVGTHPAVMQDWVRGAAGDFTPNPAYRPTTRDIRQRWKMRIEAILPVDLSIKHYKAS
ncbi:MAG: glycosyltransferase [Phycisphaerales bacterium]